MRAALKQLEQLAARTTIRAGECPVDRLRHITIDSRPLVAYQQESSYPRNLLEQLRGQPTGGSGQSFAPHDPTISFAGTDACV